MKSTTNQNRSQSTGLFFDYDVDKGEDDYYRRTFTIKYNQPKYYPPTSFDGGIIAASNPLSTEGAAEPIYSLTRERRSATR